LTTGIHVPGLNNLRRLSNGTCPEEGEQVAIDEAEKTLEALTASVSRAASHAADAYVKCCHPTEKLLSCASCGVRRAELQGEYKSFPLSSLSLLGYDDCHLSDIERRHRISTTAEEYRVVYSYYICPLGRWYHLHPEFVSSPSVGLDSERVGIDSPRVGLDRCASEISAVLCGSCADACSKWNNGSFGDKGLSKCRPKRSICGGADFGDMRRLGLEPLSPLEAQVMSRARIYMSVVKVSGKHLGRGESPTMRAQCITFKQENGWERLAGTFRFPTDLHERFSVVFVGPKEQYEKRLGAALPFGSILKQPNVDLMLKYALALRALRYPGYESEDPFVVSEEVRNYYSGGPKDEGRVRKRHDREQRFSSRRRRNCKQFRPCSSARAGSFRAWR